MYRTYSYLYAKQGRFLEADSYAKKAFEIDTNFASYNLISWLLIESEKDLDHGIKLAKITQNKLTRFDLWFLKINHYRALPEHTIGLGYLKKGDYNQAVEYLQKAYKLLPNRNNIQSDLTKAKEMLARVN